METAREDKLEAALPIDLIREHINDDDTERFSRAQLGLYREAAFEAFELYTGLSLIEGRRREMEVVTLRLPMGGAMGVGVIRPIVRLKKATCDGIITVQNAVSTMKVYTAPGARQFEYRPSSEPAPFYCGDNRRIREIIVSYHSQSGYEPGEIPAGAKIGCLKFIAWNVAHPGDQLTPVPGSRGATSGVNASLMLGSNNTALASGAIETWMQYRPKVTR